MQRYHGDERHSGSPRVFSLDGFGSHLNVHSLKVFADHKIVIVKEESDISQVSQAYDQQVTKEDKRVTCELLDGYKIHIKHVVTQWELILIINAGLNEVAKGDAWRMPE